MTEPEDINTLSHTTRFPVALPTALRWSHALLGPRLRAGDVVVDATAGNGHDTVFLAQRVLPGGRVFVFDVQAAALERTKSQIFDDKSQIKQPDAIALIHAGHERLEEYLPPELRGGIRAFMFNLGWLPGSDKACITRTETTLTALRKATDWLAEGGMITIVCYPGHDGGDAEANAVEQWAAHLPADSFEAQKIAFLNLDGAPPRCVVLRKRARLTARTFG
ncbi:MAG: hypothetical protein K8R87_02915 [Verrucomicrobia bacterium]|nr:hypothetical protein [Verrucomicrobiota bacterium]